MEKNLGQKIAIVFAALSYLSAVGCAVGAYMQPGTGYEPIRAALMASVVFFVGSGIVLHVIGTARLKGILSSAPTGDKPDSTG